MSYIRIRNSSIPTQNCLFFFLIFISQFSDKNYKPEINILRENSVHLAVVLIFPTHPLSTFLKYIFILLCFNKQIPIDNVISDKFQH